MNPILRRMSAMTLGCTLAAVGLAANGVASEDGSAPITMPVPYSAVASLPVAEASASVSYGDDPLQTILRFDPEIAHRGDIALIHGGCWSASFNRDHTLPLAGALRDEGYRVWLPEYRRVGDEGGGWPGTWSDIEAVLTYVRSEAGDGGLVAVGHSAGGHLVLLAATTPGTPITAAIGLAPITDLAEYAAGSSSCQAMVPRLMGVPLADDPEAYERASPTNRAVSVPVVIIQGEADPIVPMAQAAGVADARLVTIPEAGHFDLIHPQTPAFQLLLAQLDEVLP